MARELKEEYLTLKRFNERYFVNYDGCIREGIFLGNCFRATYQDLRNEFIFYFPDIKRTYIKKENLVVYETLDDAIAGNIDPNIFIRFDLNHKLKWGGATIYLDDCWRWCSWLWIDKDNAPNVCSVNDKLKIETFEITSNGITFYDKNSKKIIIDKGMYFLTEEDCRKANTPKVIMFDRNTQPADLNAIIDR